MVIRLVWCAVMCAEDMRKKKHSFSAQPVSCKSIRAKSRIYITKTQNIDISVVKSSCIVSLDHYPDKIKGSHPSYSNTNLACWSMPRIRLQTWVCLEKKKRISWRNKERSSPHQSVLLSLSVRGCCSGTRDRSHSPIKMLGLFFSHSSMRVCVALLKLLNVDSRLTMLGKMSPSLGPTRDGSIGAESSSFLNIVALSHYVV